MGDFLWCKGSGHQAPNDGRISDELSIYRGVSYLLKPPSGLAAGITESSLRLSHRFPPLQCARYTVQQARLQACIREHAGLSVDEQGSGWVLGAIRLRGYH